jgi:biotin carboxyl carrier protein
MSALRMEIDGRTVAADERWQVAWVDRAHGVVRLTDGERSRLAVVEGRGSDWLVTLDGRRIAVTARSWREQVLAEAESTAATHHGPTEVRATLPGLVVAVEVSEGSEVTAGDALLTIEAMKMQNEVRATRSGRVLALEVRAGETVATGALLLRLE